MITLALLMMLQPPKVLTVEQKLAVREAQVEAMSIQLQLSDLQHQMEKARTKLQEAVEAAKRACGGEVAADLTCAPPKADK